MLTRQQLDAYEREISALIPEAVKDNPQVARLWMMLQATHDKEQHAYSDFMLGTEGILWDRVSILDAIHDALGLDEQTGADAIDAERPNEGRPTYESI